MPDGRGVGFYFRNVTEILLFGIKGDSNRTLLSGRFQVNLLHSIKRTHICHPCREQINNENSIMDTSLSLTGGIHLSFRSDFSVPSLNYVSFSQIAVGFLYSSLFPSESDTFRI